METEFTVKCFPRKNLVQSTVGVFSKFANFVQPKTTTHHTRGVFLFSRREFKICEKKTVCDPLYRPTRDTSELPYLFNIYIYTGAGPH